MSRQLTPSVRQLQPKDRFKKYVVIMEGYTTEPDYFTELRESYAIEHRESRIDVKIVKRCEKEDGYSAPDYLIQQAQEFSNTFELQEYDELWIVFDADSWPLQALEKLEKWKNQISYHYLAYSNPCFEIWLILHLTEEYQAIKEKLEATKLKKRSKVCKGIHGELRQEKKLSGRYNQYIRHIPLAIARAKVLDVKSKVEFPETICTRVYQLVEKLTTLPEKYVSFNPDKCHNEKEVESKFIVSYLLPKLGYKIGDWQQEVRGDGIRLDFFIKDLVIEAKHPNINLVDKHVEQLKRYLLGKNARYGVLTNAQEFRIYEQKDKLIELVLPPCFIKGIEKKIHKISQLIGKNVLNPENKVLEHFDHPPSVQVIGKQNDMKVIGIYHNKGGVGKTTVAVNLAAAFRNIGKRVLLIDIDAQANATFATGLIKFLTDEEDYLEEANVSHLLTSSDSGFISDLRLQSNSFNDPEIDVIPSHISLTDKQGTLVRYASSRLLLHNKIQQAEQDYDIVIIDAPPSRDIYAEMTLIASDYLIIPSDLKPFANQGLSGVKTFIKITDDMRISIGKEALKIIGVLPSKILPNSQYLKYTFEKQKQRVVGYHNLTVMNSRILDIPAKLAGCLTKDIEIGELIIPDPQSIFKFAKNSDSAKEFNTLANEVLKNIGLTQ